MIKFFMALSFSSLPLLAVCAASTNCEAPIAIGTKMTMATVKAKMDMVNNKIMQAEEKYNEANNELDKEIAYLEMVLAAEMYIYKELDEVRHNINQINEIDGTNLSVMLGEYEQ